MGGIIKHLKNGPTGKQWVWFPLDLNVPLFPSGNTLSPGKSKRFLHGFYLVLRCSWPHGETVPLDLNVPRLRGTLRVSPGKSRWEQFLHGFYLVLRWEDKKHLKNGPTGKQWVWFPLDLNVPLGFPSGNTEGLAGEKQTISSRFLSGVEMGGIIKHLKNGPTGKQWVWFPLDLNVPLGFPSGNTEGLAGEKQTISSRFLSGVEMGGIIKHLKNGPTGKQWVWFPLDLNVPLGFPSGNTEGLAGEKQTISSRFLSGVEMGGIIKHLKNGPTGKQWVWFPLDLNVPLGFPSGNTEGLAGEKQTISSRFLSGVEMGGIIKHLKNGPTGKQWVWFPLDLNVPLGFPSGNTEGLAGEKQTISSRFLSGVEMGGIIKHLKSGPTGKQWVWFPLDLNVLRVSPGKKKLNVSLGASH